MNIELTAEQINGALTKAVIESAIGQEIERAVKGALNNYELKTAIQNAVRGVAVKHVEAMAEADQEFKTRLRAAVIEAMTDDSIKKFVDKLIQRIYDY